MNWGEKNSYGRMESVGLNRFEPGDGSMVGLRGQGWITDGSGRREVYPAWNTSTKLEYRLWEGPQCCVLYRLNVLLSFGHLGRSTRNCDLGETRVKVLVG